MPVNNGTDRTDDTDLLARMLQNRLYHVGGRRFTFGSGNADHRELFGGMTVLGSSGKCFSCVFCGNHSCMFSAGSIHHDLGGSNMVVINDQSRGALFQHLRNIFVGIAFCTGNADKDTAGGDFTGVIDDLRHFCGVTSGLYLIR